MQKQQALLPDCVILYSSITALNLAIILYYKLVASIWHIHLQFGKIFMADLEHFLQCYSLNPLLLDMAFLSSGCTKMNLS